MNEEVLKTLEKRIKQVYPDHQVLYELLEKKDIFSLIRELESLLTEPISPYEIITAFQTNEKLANLFAKARRACDKNDVYTMAMLAYEEGS